MAILDNARADLMKKQAMSAAKALFYDALA
jgi:hypothetical protein